MNSENLLDYLRTQQVAPQWLGFLRALASELAAQADDEALRTLFNGVGAKLAVDAQASMAEIDSLKDLQQALNAHWEDIQWGWVEMDEQEDFVEVTHYLAPLQEAFSEGALSWSVGVLEGFYQTVFQSLGADASLQLRHVPTPNDGWSLHFRFGRG